MKIAFVGKGGSGKTTVSALFSRFLAEQAATVLAIDADINQHLGHALGFEEATLQKQPALGLNIDYIKEYLRGDNPLIHSNEHMAKTTPPGSGSNLLRLHENNPIWSFFQREKDGIRLLATGPFDKKDLGTKCYHSKTGAVELILNHLIDQKNEYVVQDMTAGADSFASGMFTRFDITFLVAEPTMRGVSVFQQYKDYADGYDVKLCVIGNKVEDDEDVAFLRHHVGDALLGCIGRSRFVRKMEKGQLPIFSELETSTAEILHIMKTHVDVQKKDWQKFYNQMVEFHIRNANAWASKQIGEDLTKQIDPEFAFSKAVASL
jgi:CO dehydrogenase maturation factor